MKTRRKSVAFDAVLEEDRIRAILTLGRRRFGDPDRKTEAKLAAIQDLERLQHMIDAVLTADSWKSLLAVK